MRDQASDPVSGATPNGRAASPALLSAVDASGGRVTPVKEGFGPDDIGGPGVSNGKSPGHGGSDGVRNEYDGGQRSYTFAWVGWEGSCEPRVDSISNRNQTTQRHPQYFCSVKIIFPDMERPPMLTTAG